MKMQQRGFYPWLVVGLLWVVALLNYMDRQMLSTMQASIGATIPAVRDPANFGRLMAIFLWVYGLCSPLSGAVADRLNRKWLIVGSLGVWSAVTYLMGYCHTFHQIYWLRGVMGISEALYIPSALSLIADYFAGGRGRSMAIGIHMTGLYCGQALGGFGATVAHAFSWQATFHWFGIVGVGYALVLMALLRERRGAAGAPRQEARELLGAEAPEIEVQPLPKHPRRPWRAMLGGFAMIFSNVAFWVILFFFASSSLPGWATKNWLPTLFADNLGLAPQAAGPAATITIAVASFLGVMVGGPLSDRWVRRNLRGRIYTSAIGMAMMVPALVLIGLGHNAFAAVGAGLFFGIGYGMFDANNMPILCQFVPARQRASAYGLMNMTGVFAGAATTEVLGNWAKEGDLGLGFALMGGVILVAVALQLTVLRPKSDNMTEAQAATPTNPS